MFAIKICIQITRNLEHSRLQLRRVFKSPEHKTLTFTIKMRIQITRNIKRSCLQLR